MKNSISTLLILFSTLICFSQTPQEFCKEWGVKMDTTTNLDQRFKICQDYLPKVNEYCKLNIYMDYAAILEEATKIDSAKYYYNKIIKLSKSTTKTEHLTTSFSRLSQFATDEGDIDKAHDLLQQARAILNKEPESRGWISYYDANHTIATSKSDYNLANTYLDSIIIYSIRIKDTSPIANIYHNKAITYSYAGNYEAATENYLKAVELKEKMEHQIDLDVTYYSLGYSYTETKQFELAKKYQMKSIKLAKENGDDFIVLANYLMLAYENRKLDKYDEALVAADSAMNIAKALNLDIYKADSYAEKGWVYYEKYKDYDKAEDYFTKAYELVEFVKEADTQIGILEGLIETLIARENYVSAGKYLKILKKMIAEAKIPKYTSDFNKLYSKYYEKVDEPALAIYYLKDYYKIKDSIANSQVLTKVADLEKKYQTQKKELQIATLNSEKEEQLVITEKATQRQNIFLITAITLLSLLLISFWLFKKLQKQQQNLTKAHNELNEINSVKNRLFSIIAHDLRGMLLPFQRSGKIIKHHLDQDNQDKALEVAQEIEKNSDNLSNMLDNLLEWSLNQMNGYKLNPTSISIKDELEFLVASFEQQAQFKSVSIELKYDKDEHILIDKGAFHVIFRNLISNALKYTEEGNIIISFKKELDTINFSVNDSGIGMTEEQLNALFKLKDNKTTVGTKGEKGTGIGLNLVYRFIKMLQGNINISSEKRIGTQINISIPILESLKTTFEKNRSISA